MPTLSMAERLGGKRVRLFFSDGVVVERDLPVASRTLEVIDEGLGLSIGRGAGEEISAGYLYARTTREKRWAQA
jgi:hypothetical protein